MAKVTEEIRITVDIKNEDEAELIAGLLSDTWQIHNRFIEEKKKGMRGQQYLMILQRKE